MNEPYFKIKKRAQKQLVRVFGIQLNMQKNCVPLKKGCIYWKKPLKFNECRLKLVKK